MWSYSGDPASSSLDQVRFWLQDTDADNQLVNDEELTWLYDMHGKDTDSGEIWVAALAAEVLASRYAREVSISADGVSVQLSELQDRFEKLAASLREQWRELGKTASGDFAGVLMDTSRDPGIRPLMFGIGLHDNYEAGLQDYGGHRLGHQSWSADFGAPQVYDELEPPSPEGAS